MASKRKRANGTGSVYKDGSGYCAAITRYVDGQRVVKRKWGFRTKAEAYAWLAQPHETSSKVYSFAAVYSAMIARQKERVGKSTIDCYNAAYKYYKELYAYNFAELSTADWQECVDNCPHGKRTRQNMKAVGTLMYKYAIENRIATTDYAKYIWIKPEGADERTPFTQEQLAAIVAAARGGDEGAMLTACLCYTGFRPTEFFSLTSENFNGEMFVGGAKTDAGRNRKVPVSAKIKPFVEHFIVKGQETIFGSGRQFRDEGFYRVLADLGIQPLGEKTYTPYACRHTFATMLKGVDGAATDKSALMGHTSPSMTEHYQHQSDEDLTKIISQL